MYFYALGFSLNARPHKRQRFNHYRVEIKVVVLLYCIVLLSKIAYVQFSNQDPAFTSEKQYYFTLSPVDNLKCYLILSCVSNKHFVFTRRKVE